MIDPSSDGALVAEALAGYDEAFAEIVRRHRDALYRIAYATLGDADEALDAVQDALIAAHGALRRFDRARPLRPWLSRIVLNRCRDVRRRRTVRRMLLPFAAVAEQVADDAPGPAALAGDRRTLARTLTAIAALPTNLREPLVLTAIDAMPQADVAEALGITTKAVETRVRRARAALRASMPEIG